MTTNASQSLQDQLQEIVRIGQTVSQQHRLPYSTGAVLDRLKDILEHNRDLFQDWTLEICFLLEHDGVLRYGELKKHLTGIGTRTLATKLAALQVHGFVEREFFDEIPPRVEYRLTETGRRFTQSLFPILLLLQRPINT